MQDTELIIQCVMYVCKQNSGHVFVYNLNIDQKIPGLDLK